MRLTRLAVAAAGLVLLSTGAGSAKTSETAAAPATTKGTVRVTVTDLRSAKGEVHVCLAPDSDSFPDCGDGHGRTLTMPAKEVMNFTFPGVPSGRYAIALLHDENANGKIDKVLMIPREGFGFSQNARLRMGPPAFKDAAFTVDENGASQSIRMRYIM